jgi:lyso-ornithine lipid O-acyltransferase
MTDWRDEPIETPAIGPLGWATALLRGTVLGSVTYGGLALLLMVRLIERPLFKQDRPWTPHITQTVCRAAFPILGLGFQVWGKPMAIKGAVVANHSSWLDIFALNAAERVYFVSKSEVERWPLIGWLARATGTVFIARKGSEAKRQQAQFEERLRAGHRLLFFPEGTSTDAVRVLPFKSTLFAAFYTHGLDHILHIQPVSVIYHAPKGQDPRYYGWWGEMDFATHLLRTLATRQQGKVEVIFHDPVPVDGFADRKALTAHCERVIRDAHDLALGRESSIREEA